MVNMRIKCFYFHQTCLYWSSLSTYMGSHIIDPLRALNFSSALLFVPIPSNIGEALTQFFFWKSSDFSFPPSRPSKRASYYLHRTPSPGFFPNLLKCSSQILASNKEHCMYIYQNYSSSLFLTVFKRRFSFCSNPFSLYSSYLKLGK